MLKILPLLLVAIPITASAAPSPIGKVASLKGRAASTSVPKGLALESPVFEGDEIRTKEGTELCILLDDGEALQLGSNAKLRIEREGDKPTTVQLLAGGLLSAVRSAVKAGAAPRYEVRTKTAVMGVRGTVFYVEEHPRKPTFLCTCLGTVALKWKGGETSFTSKHHDAPKIIDPSKPDLVPAEMGHGHTDEQAAALLELLK